MLILHTISNKKIGMILPGSQFIEACLILFIKLFRFRLYVLINTNIAQVIRIGGFFGFFGFNPEVMIGSLDFFIFVRVDH